MYEQFGYSASATGQQNISLFVPDNAVDPSQYIRGGPSRIVSVSLIGDFQHIVVPKANDWDAANALPLTRVNHPKGFLHSYNFLKPLPPGYYQYKFVVTFQNGTVRQIGDPCTKYGGDSDDRSAFVVGGSPVVAKPIAVRLPPGDLQIYELMIDDFTSGFRNNLAALDAVVTKLDTLAALNVNAIEFMPWTAWPDDSGLTTFSWGYNPAYFFSVESSYMVDPGNPLDRLSRLANLVNECHKRELGVILDIVLQHASQGATTNGFPYYWLWQNANECPFVGSFVQAPTFGSLPLDYDNLCTQQFATDVCTYWIDRFQLDGLRFDQVTGFDNPQFPSKGAPGLIAALNTHLQTNNIKNVALMLEDSWGFDAVGDANNIKPTGAWFDMFRSGPFGIFSGFAVVNHIDTTYMRILNSSLDFNFPIGPVNYIENHDHGSVTCRVGSRSHWFKVQPYLIALAACPGAMLIHNGQEWGQFEDIWEDDNNAPYANRRVQPRPLLWAQAADTIGTAFISIHQLLLGMRQNHPGLRSPNFYPSFYDQQWTSLSPEGYGIDVNRQIVIFHRWGNDASGTLERFIIVLNFNDFDQSVSVPFPANGIWSDLINGNGTVEVQNFWLNGYLIPSNWGCVFWLR
jgi:pullulanase